MMKRQRHLLAKGFFLRLSLLCCLLFTGVPASAMDHPLPASFTGRELVLNGGFEHGPGAWSLIGSYSGVRSESGPEGGKALELENFSGSNDPRAFAVQTLHLPTRITAGTYRFDYRLVQQQGGYAGGLTVNLMKGTSLETAVSIGDLFSSDWVFTTTDWQSVNGDLTDPQIQEVQNAHDAGEWVWLVFTLYQSSSAGFAPNQFNAFVDNVSMLVSGDMTYPAGLGAIAFISAGQDGYPLTVNRIDVDGSGRQTLWTHPGTGIPRGMYGLAWKPDGSQIAFSSDHEGSCSAFDSDVYGIRPDGTDLRRITNPPSKETLDKGLYSTGTVTGRIQNDFGNVGAFLIYIQGAGEPLAVDIGDWGTQTPFTVPDVADLGDGPQYLAFIWGGTGCREYTAAAVSVVPGAVVDVGTISFGGACGVYNSNHISWKGDGTELGVDVITPRRFLAGGQAIGTDLFNASLTADRPAWSPMDDSLLYFESGTGARGIYRTFVGKDAGERLKSTGTAFNVSMSWLPDGSGFVYAMDDELRQFLFQGGQDTLLIQLYNEWVYSPSLSGDGAYVVFERRNRENAGISDIWVLQRSRPNQLWALTGDGKSTQPDWARATASRVYRVVYDGNGNTGGMPPLDPEAYLAGATVTVMDNSGNLFKDGYSFDGWSTDANGVGTTYRGRDTFGMGASDMILYAQWRAVSVAMDITSVISILQALAGMETSVDFSTYDVIDEGPVKNADAVRLLHLITQPD
jgi:uncharacterized repeat protein (TIGR02543 family)